MINLEEIKIKGSSNILQKAIDHFIEEAKEAKFIDLNNNIISELQVDEVSEFSYQVFNEYEVYNNELLDLAKDLYFEGYNVLEKAIELKEDNILIVNEVLRDYIFDRVMEHQNELINLTEKNKQKENQLNFER